MIQPTRSDAATATLQQIQIGCSGIRKNSERRTPEFLRIQLNLNAAPFPNML